MWQLKWEEGFFKLTFSHIESERNKKKNSDERGSEIFRMNMSIICRIQPWIFEPEDEKTNDKEPSEEVTNRVGPEISVCCCKINSMESSPRKMGEQIYWPWVTLNIHLPL